MNCATCVEISQRALACDVASVTAIHLRQSAKAAESYVFHICDEDYAELMLDIVPLDTRQPEHIRGILLDPEWIDLQTTQRWIACCDSKHSGAC